MSLAPPVLERAAQEVKSVVLRTRMSLSNEKDAQAELHTALAAAGIDAVREVRLSSRDIVDLFLPCGLALEVKLRGSGKRAVYAQLARYAEHDRVLGLMLVTNLAMGLPPAIGGKPRWVASLGQGWL